MAGTEHTELIALCEDILDDGEVTVEEIIRLAEWLQNHENARLSWPGEVLMGPVQEVLLVGKVNKTELRRMSRILREIHKEWVTRQQDHAEQAAIQQATNIIQNFDLTRACLPVIPITIEVITHSDRTVRYYVNLSGPSCSCPDWTGNRARLPIGHLTRCCKHIFDAFNRIRPIEGWPDWLGVFLEQGWKPHPQREWYVLSQSSQAVLVGTGGNEWVDVYARVRNEYHRFGYNVIQMRWSYGEEPTGAATIVRSLKKRPSEEIDGPGSFWRRLFKWIKR